MEMMLTAKGDEVLTGAILTPYNAQAKLIKELVKNSNAFKNTKAGQVDRRPDKHPPSPPTSHSCCTRHTTAVQGDH